MNPVLETMSSHRTVRSFAPDPLDDARVREAVAAAQCASSSSNVQAYSLLRVRDAATRDRLVELAGGQPQVGAAGAFLVVCGDVRRHRLAAARAGREWLCNLETFLLAVVDASLFAQNLALAFESQGLGICFIGGLRNRLPEADALLELPAGVLPLFGLCVGVPADDPDRRPRLAVDAVLHEERYPDDATVLARLDAYDEVMGAWYAARGKPGHDWTGGITRLFATLRREHLKGFFEAKGIAFR